VKPSALKTIGEEPSEQKKKRSPTTTFLLCRKTSGKAGAETLKGGKGKENGEKSSWKKKRERDLRHIAMQTELSSQKKGPASGVGRSANTAE